jgi:hypothetical protein
MSRMSALFECFADMSRNKVARAQADRRGPGCTSDLPRFHARTWRSNSGGRVHRYHSLRNYEAQLSIQTSKRVLITRHDDMPAEFLY